MDRATAKVFISENSQAIRLPEEFRVEGDEVYITKNRGCIVITLKKNREVFKKALDSMFDYCPVFDAGRERINDKLRKVRL